MTATLGRILILASVLVSTGGAVIGFYAGRSRSREGLHWAQRFAYLYALLTRDFSVSYVAHVGSRSTPTWVTIASLWSSLEGSILFWGLILGVYIAGATFLSRNDHQEYTPD